MIVQSDDFIQQNYDTLKQIMQLERTCDEKIVLDNCLAWAAKRCKDKAQSEDHGQMLKKHLGDCFYLIWFNKIKLADFKKITSKYEKLFTTAELIDITQSISVDGYESKFFRK